MNGRVQQHGPDRQPDRDVDRADKGHVNRPVRHLVCCAIQVDSHFVTINCDGDNDGQILLVGIRAVEKPINKGLRTISTVRHLSDC